MLVYDENVSRHFWRIAIVILVEVLTQKGAIVRIKKANTILKCLVNILFGIKYTYHDTNQTDKAREQKIR